MQNMRQKGALRQIYDRTDALVRERRPVHGLFSGGAALCVESERCRLTKRHTQVGSSVSGSLQVSPTKDPPMSSECIGDFGTSVAAGDGNSAPPQVSAF